MEERFDINERVKVYNKVGEVKDISFNENLRKTVYLICFENSTYQWCAKDEIEKVA